MTKNFISGIMKQNPIFLMLLGIVPVLGTTTLALTAIIMGIITFVILLLSGVFIFQVKCFLNQKTELFVYILTTATLTTIAMIAVKFFDINMYNKLGIYLPLTVVNCLILNSLNVVSATDEFKPMLYSLLKNGLYFFFAISLVGILRESLGNGSVFGFTIIPEYIPRLLIAQMPAGAFFILATMCILANKLKGAKV